MNCKRFRQCMWKKELIITNYKNFEEVFFLRKVLLLVRKRFDHHVYPFINSTKNMDTINLLCVFIMDNKIILN